MSGPIHRRFNATASEVPSAAQFVAATARGLGMADDHAARLELAVEEAVANICRHAYRDGGGPVWIEVERRTERIEVLIADEGPPFDPFAAAPPVLGETLEDREPGGLGIRMILSFVDDARYERMLDRNVLTLACAVDGGSEGDEA